MSKNRKVEIRSYAPKDRDGVRALCCATGFLGNPIDPVFEDRELFADGEKRVYGQIVVFEDRRGAKLFERYGFKVLNRQEITKYRHLHPERVYLCTVVKELA